MAAYVNERLQIIRTDAMSPQAHVIACNRVQTADANILLTVQMPGWHGAGFYPADEWPENEHGWYATVGRDQMLGDERRLIDLRTIRQFPAHSLCSDQLYVIGCVSEQLKTVFQDRYENLKSINAAGENLSLVLWDLNGRDPYDPGRDANMSWERRLTYSWNSELQGYVLSKVRVGPPLADSTLPSKPPPCAAPTQ